jgi:hypothetical protein
LPTCSSQKAVKERVKKILKGCIKSGELKVVPGEDAKRQQRRYVVKGVTADLGKK